MKKTLVACLAVAALFAVAPGANAITCTQDHRPAATLLIPYFQATFVESGPLAGTILGTGGAALDTLVTIGNASSAPMIAHVSVWSERTELVLDFNIALTGFDIQAFSMASILRGNLPQTPVNQAHVSNVKDSNQVTLNGDVCQRNPASVVYPATGGFLRVKPANAFTANSLDNSLATAQYQAGPFSTVFLFQVLDSLDKTPDSNTCTPGPPVDQVITNPIHGYLTIDHVNYCTLGNPNDNAYYFDDAIGMENNLWGDYIFTSGAGLNTIGFPAVALEADFTLSDVTAAPTTLAGAAGRRTFYRRYVQPLADPAGCNPGNTDWTGRPQAAYDCGGGDQREPLGLRYAARWFDAAPAVTSFFNVWRASSVPSTVSGGLADLLGFSAGKCNTSEPTVTLNFYDEDENTVTSGVCPSPCTQPTFNFPLETQRSPITAFSHPNWPAGWVEMIFFNASGPVAGVLDQAYVTYDFQGPAAFLSAGVEATQLDPSECQPIGVLGVTVTNPVIPTIPTGVGP